MRFGFQKQKRGMQSGLALVETLVYVFILGLLLTVLVTSLTSLVRSYRSARNDTDMQSSAFSVLERMTREIRDAKSIDTTGSTLGTSPGKLILNTTDADDNATTTEFNVTSQAIRVKEGATDIGPLTRSGILVTSFIVRSIITGTSSAVKIEMTLQSGTGTEVVSKSFYSTAVLRGSYPSN